MIIENIQKKLWVLAPNELEVRDVSSQHAGHAGYKPGQITHVVVRMVCHCFCKQDTRANHHLIYQLLADEIKQLHSIQLILQKPAYC